MHNLIYYGGVLTVSSSKSRGKENKTGGAKNAKPKKSGKATSKVKNSGSNKKPGMQIKP